ncbi:helix-turn-helix domain-containing protein [Sulfodiicoccus acidiphilus]|uniref:helix-turn-helix domain-containing protein n=1 Tax=Sulfodiicoccus acidiphilus TaxID=1670455 RepID=UPI001E55D786|nr:helix-turn-helix domain-containing protein [Sulfodiicoccus acidiphilus]
MKQPIQVELYVRREDCRVMHLLGGRHSVIERVIPKGEVSDHLIRVKDLDPQTRSAMKSVGVKVVRLGDEWVWARSPSCSACRFLSSAEVLTLNAWPLSQNEIVYRLLVPSVGNVRDVLRELDRLGLRPRVTKSVPAKPRRKDLTPRQLQALLLAFRKGYFDVDREATLTELARTLGVAPASAQELLRRALKKVVEDFLEGIQKD